MANNVDSYGTASVDKSKVKNGRVHCRNSGIKEIQGRLQGIEHGVEAEEETTEDDDLKLIVDKMKQSMMSVITRRHKSRGSGLRCPVSAIAESTEAVSISHSIAIVARAWAAGPANKNNNSNDKKEVQELRPSTSSVPSLRTLCSRLQERLKRISRKRRTSEDGSIVKKKKKKKEYTLTPLNYGHYGEIMAVGPGGKRKYPDVATVINQGTIMHDNINTVVARKHAKLETLDERKIWLDLKLFYVQPIAAGTIHLDELMVQNGRRWLFDEYRARFVCAHLLQGAEFLHENGIIHGSIMPRKIVINEKGYPQLAYFNTAERAGHRHSRLRETLPIEYTAPEQLHERLAVTTDIFAIAVVTYEMIFGRVPHAGDSYAETRRNLCNVDFVPVFITTRLSLPGQRFLAACLRCRRSERFNIVRRTKPLMSSFRWFRGIDEHLLFLQAIDSPLKARIHEVRLSRRNEPTAGTSTSTE